MIYIIYYSYITASSIQVFLFVDFVGWLCIEAYFAATISDL